MASPKVQTPDEGFLERMFQLKANNTSVRTEILAGVTTFMTMAYIIMSTSIPCVKMVPCSDVATILEVS